MDDEISRNILEHIEKAQKQALKEHIRANTILIDKEVAKLNGFYFKSSCNFITQIPNMILGLKVIYSDNLSDELGIKTNFAITRVEEPKKYLLSDYSTDELLEEIKRRIGEVQDA